EFEPANWTDEAAFARGLDEFRFGFWNGSGSDHAFFGGKLDFEQAKLAEIKSGAHAVWKGDCVFAEVGFLREHQHIHEVWKRTFGETFFGIVNEPFTEVQIFFPF